jgi:peroxiredoxin
VAAGTGIFVTELADTEENLRTRWNVMLKIGDKAPDFVLPSDEGEEVSLERFKGKRVLIFFYPKANTSG